jgi:hypothetical protein
MDLWTVLVILTGVLVGMVIWKVGERVVRNLRYLHHKPCCPTCKGTGVDGTSYSNGMCWDCRGTGHCHPIRKVK